MSQPKHPQLATSAAIFRDGKVLLVRRAYAPGKGLYSLPGGRVEFGESLAEALAREVMEETGLVIDLIGLSGFREVLPRSGAGGHYLVMSFAARWVEGEPELNDEHDDFQWVTLAEIGRFQTTEGLAPILAMARELAGS